MNKGPNSIALGLRVDPENTNKTLKVDPSQGSEFGLECATPKQDVAAAGLTELAVQA